MMNINININRNMNININTNINVNKKQRSNREGSRVGVDIDPVCEFSDHIAAVKAVGWSPHQHGTLASGGGTADRYTAKLYG